MSEPSQVGRTLDELERDRAQDLQRTLPWIIAIAVATLTLAALALFVGLGGGAALSVATIGLTICAAIFARYLIRIDRAFKEALMPEILARVHPGLDRFDFGGLPRERFDQLELFRKPDHYISQDLVSGRIGATAIAFAMVFAEVNRGKKTETVFEGLLFVADFHKHFNGRTVMKDARRPSFLDFFADPRVDLEDPRFTELFRTTSTDQIEARYILTPRLCERMVRLRERFRSADVVFEDSCVVLALGESYGMLDPYLADGIGADDIDDMVQKLKDVVGIVEELNLNTRIWSKRPEPA